MPEQNPFAGREVKSRRGGKVKAPLSRERIVDEALALLGRHGLEGMSLRAVAAALDTGAASLYPYVDGLDSLRALVLDRALERVSTPDNRRRGWRSRLEAVLESYGRVLLATPGLAQLALSTIAAGPNSLRVIESLLEALEDGGIDPASAAWAVDLFLLYVTAIGAEQGQRDTATRLGPITHALSAVSPQEFPRVHAARKELLSGEGGDRFAWAIDTLVTGVLNNRRGPARLRSPR